MNECITPSRQFVRDNLPELCREMLACMEGDGTGPLLTRLIEIDGSQRFVGEIVRAEAVRRVAESAMEKAV